MFPLTRPIKLFLLVMVVAGCASISGITELELQRQYGDTLVLDRRMPLSEPAANHYATQVKPILDNRCVVCHGCYDAPCQLKLSSPEGILRGASKELVYDGTRILAASPTRIGIDASSTKEWRDQGFHPILNERSQQQSINLENSALFQLLVLKQENPLPKDKILSDEFELGLDRNQQCPAPNEINHYKEKHPSWGMPYALPGLTSKEMTVLTQWISDGASMNLPAPLSEHMQKRIRLWETFLNQTSLKAQLTSRYIYEHLYLANLYFSDEPLFTQEKLKTRPTHFFKLVRSATPPGLPIKPIATRRPYDDPGVSKVYYRLMLNTETIVEKTHMPYRLNQERMTWIQSLFLSDDYEVTSLPSYETEVAANPFIAFHQLPVSARYRFMLQEAKYIIQGFIKGPVCRGQVALNVIDDHFWVAFIDPDYQDDQFFSKFLKEQSHNLRLPGESESNSGILTNWLEYSHAHNQYLKAKNQAMQRHFLNSDKLNLDILWKGDQQNSNAALSIFRHFDSSTVLEGWVGQNPKTTWVITYPLLERIHYLLVAEFDVYGNIGHQLLTRLYMDFLRMEGEANFLAFLPQEERKRLTNHWYRDTFDRVKTHLVNFEENLYGEPAIDYQTAQPKDELLDMIKQHLGESLSQRYTLTSKPKSTANVLSLLNSVVGEGATLMPEISILMVENSATQPEVFTILRNSGHSNLNGLLTEDLNRLPEEDYLTVIPGITGSYPSAYYRTSQFRLKEFVNKVQSLESESDYAALMDAFGVRRTNPQFWQHSDDIHEWFRINEPLEHGLLDYNRLENR